jgi:hypothetical protein
MSITALQLWIYYTYIRLVPVAAATARLGVGINRRGVSTAQAGYGGSVHWGWACRYRPWLAQVAHSEVAVAD